MTTDERAPEPVEELADEVRQENPDPTTQREAMERELTEQGLAEEAGEIGDEVDRLLVLAM